MVGAAYIISLVKRLLHDLVRLDFEALAYLLIVVFQSDELLVGLAALDSHGLFLLVGSFQVCQQRSLLVDFRRGSVVVVNLTGALSLHHQIDEAVFLLGVRRTALGVASFLEEVDRTSLGFRNRLMVKLVLTYGRLLHLRV